MIKYVFEKLAFNGRILMTYVVIRI